MFKMFKIFTMAFKKYAKLNKLLKSGATPTVIILQKPFGSLLLNAHACVLADFQDK